MSLKFGTAQAVQKKDFSFLPSKDHRTSFR